MFTIVLLACAAVGPNGDSSDQKTAANEDSQRRAEVSRVAYAEGRRLSLTVGKDHAVPAQLQPESVLRWSNPTVAAVYGEVFVWTLNSRPVAAGSVYYAYDRPWGWTLELVSTSELPIQAREEQKTIWDAESAGLEFRPLLDVPEPSQKAATRLGQMRALAKRFSAEMIDRRNDDEVKRQLRLLPQPVYRYPAAAEHLIDGALFSFVEATDPEIWIVLEAIENGDATGWRYGLARMNGSPMEVRFDGSVVQSWERIEKPWADRKAPYFSYTFLPPLR